MCPLPCEERKVFGVPHLATQTTNIETLNWGESKWRRIMVGGVGGGGGGGVGEGLSATHWEWNVENVEKGISHLIKLMKQ